MKAARAAEAGGPDGRLPTGDRVFVVECHTKMAAARSTPKIADDASQKPLDLKSAISAGLTS